MSEVLSWICIGIGLIFMFWGTAFLLGSRSVLYKLHTISVADTLGSMLILFGLLLKVPAALPWLILAIASLAIWNTMLGYVLAYCSTQGGADD